VLGVRMEEGEWDSLKKLRALYEAEKEKEEAAPNNNEQEQVNEDN